MPTSPNAAPRPRRLRNTGLSLLGVVLLLVIAVGICEFVEWPFLRHPLENKLSQILERPVSFGDQFGVRLLGSVRGHTNAMVIGPVANGGPTLVDDSGKPRDFMRADSVKLALTYSALYHQWKGDAAGLQVHLLDVDGIELNLKRNADGHANWEFGSAQPATAASSPQLPRFDLLNVRNGEVRYQDVPLQIDADAHVVTHEGTAVSSTATASAASGPAPDLRIAEGASVTAASGSTAAAGMAPGASAAASSAGTVAVDDDSPGLRVDGTGSYRKAPLIIKLRSSGLLPLAASDGTSPPVPLWLDVHANKSSIHVEGTATDLLHFGGMDATFKASGPSLAAVGDAIGVTLPTTPRFSTHGSLRKNGAVWSAGVAALSIGSSRLHGDFTFDTGPSVPVLKGTLQGSRLALVDLGPAFGAAAPDAPASSVPQKSARVLPEREFDIPSLRAMNADVGVQLAVVDFGTDKLEPFKPLQGRITLQDGVLTLSDLLARTSAGEVRGLVGLDSRPASPKWNADLRWSGIQLDRFVTLRDTMVRKNAQGTKPDTGYISGALGGNAQLTGNGKSTAALLASLDGQVRLWVRDGTVSHVVVEAAGIDVAQALGVYVEGDNEMPMQCALTQLRITNGKVVPEVGVIDTKDTTMLIGGELSLADESLNLQLTAHPHDFSPLAPRSPIEVKGSFSDPHVRLQAKPLLIRAGAAAVLSLATPLAGLLALVDFKQAERDVCTKAVASVDGAAKVGLRTGPADGQRAPKRAAKNARRP